MFDTEEILAEFEGLTDSPPLFQHGFHTFTKRYAAPKPKRTRRANYEATKAWKQRNPDRVRQARRRYYRRHRAEILAKQRSTTAQWLAANKEKVRETKRAYYQANRARLLAAQKLIDQRRRGKR